MKNKIRIPQDTKSRVIFKLAAASFVFMVLSTLLYTINYLPMGVRPVFFIFRILDLLYAGLLFASVANLFPRFRYAIPLSYALFALSWILDMSLSNYSEASYALMVYAFIFGAIITYLGICKKTGFVSAFITIHKKASAIIASIGPVIGLWVQVQQFADTSPYLSLLISADFLWFLFFICYRIASTAFCITLILRAFMGHSPVYSTPQYTSNQYIPPKEALLSLKQAFEAGTISDTEYQRRRAEIISRL